MEEKEQINILKQIIKDTFWMARRYAHGRSTYAPSMVREAYKNITKHFSDIKIKKDITIKPPNEIKGMGLRDDYLDDIN